MNEQPNKDDVLKRTLQVLVHHLGLTPEEVAGLRLSHLHLAGKSPRISFTPAHSKEPKTVELDLDTHRAMVNWLVMRPDSTGDFIFPGREIEQMEPAEVNRLAQGGQKPDFDSSQVGEKPMPATGPVEPAPEGVSRPSPSRPVPLPSRPEMGTPPPGTGGPRGPAFSPPLTAPESNEPFAARPRVVGSAGPPPPTAPEEDRGMDIPLPTAAPKPPPVPVRPSRPVVPIRPPEAPEQPEEKKEAVPGPVLGPREPTPARAPTASRPAKPVKAPEKAETVGRERRVSKPTARQVAGRPSRARRVTGPVAALIVLLLCAVCAGGGWFAVQSGPGGDLLASLGLAGMLPTGQGAGGVEGVEVETPEMVDFQSPLDSPVATPTLPPTSTPTSAPATDTPEPTETPTPEATDTPEITPTDTPSPTDTPAPTETPTPEEPEEEEEAPAEEPAAEQPAAPPGPKYGAPALVEPGNGFEFIQGNTIVLRWQPVDLAPNEQYAVRLVYPYNGQIEYKGAQVTEPQWTVPLDLFGQIDGPDNRYEWYVYIEQVNQDGSATAVSPESERRSFTWR